MSVTSVPIFYRAEDRALAHDLAAALFTIRPGAETPLVELHPDGGFDWLNLSIFAIMVIGPRGMADAEFEPWFARVQNSTGAKRILLVTTDDFEWPDRYRDAYPRFELDGWEGDFEDPRVQAIAATVFNRGAIDPWSDPMDLAIASRAIIRQPDGSLRLNPVLLLRVDQMGLSGRLLRHMRNDNIKLFGDAVQKTEVEWLRTPGYGRQTHNELRAVVARYGLHLGVVIPLWPPDNIEAELARSELALRIGALQQEPLGATFGLGGERLTLQLGGDQDDKTVADQPLVRHLHPEIVRKAKAFQEVARRLDNQLGWQGIAGVGERLSALVDRPLHQVVDHLGAVYSGLLELGSFLEMDEGVSRGSHSNALPLDVEVRRPLVDFVRTAAPWIRNFPSIRALDDQMGSFFTPGALLAPSVAVVEKASALDLITGSDTATLIGLLDAALRGNVQGNKAKGRGVLTARNLVIAAATAVGSIYVSAVGNDLGPSSILVHRASELLSGAEHQIVELIDNLPDIRSAIRALARDNASRADRD